MEVVQLHTFHKAAQKQISGQVMTIVHATVITLIKASNTSFLKLTVKIYFIKLGLLHMLKFSQK